MVIEIKNSSAQEVYANKNPSVFYLFPHGPTGMFTYISRGQRHLCSGLLMSSSASAQVYTRGRRVRIRSVNHQNLSIFNEGGSSVLWLVNALLYHTVHIIPRIEELGYSVRLSPVLIACSEKIP
jgi:hypothetical protein